MCKSEICNCCNQGCYDPNVVRRASVLTCFANLNMMMDCLLNNSRCMFYGTHYNERHNYKILWLMYFYVHITQHVFEDQLNTTGIFTRKPFWRRQLSPPSLFSCRWDTGSWWWGLEQGRHCRRSGRSTVPNLKGDPNYSERGPKGDLILSKKGT